MNILIKLMSIVSLIIAPHIASIGNKDGFSSANEAKVTSAVTPATPAAASNATPLMDLAKMKGNIALDNSHTWVQFSISHFLTSANGALQVDSGYLNITDDLANSSLFVVANTKSIDTKNARRDNHLRSADFFEVDKYPSITYKATKIELAPEGSEYRYIAKGDLTIKGITKSTDLKFNYVGSVFNENAGTDTHSFIGIAEINRTDFGVGSSGPTVGDLVKINFSAEGYLD